VNLCAAVWNCIPTAAPWFQGEGARTAKADDTAREWQRPLDVPTLATTTLATPTLAGLAVMMPGTSGLGA
jgi:hypothetical protein